jgi:hypothetical protein
METRKFEEAASALIEASLEYDALRDHFDQLCEHAVKIGDGTLGIKGLAVARVGPDLYIDFLDHRMRLAMRYDAVKTMGVLCFDDVSAAGMMPDVLPLVVARIPFGHSGETTRGKGSATEHWTLASPSDCKNIILDLIGTAIRLNPWEKGEL